MPATPKQKLVGLDTRLRQSAQCCTCLRRMRRVGSGERAVGEREDWLFLELSSRRHAQMKEKVLSVRCRVYRAVAGLAACPSYPVAGGTRALAARCVVGRQEKPSVAASGRERERESETAQENGPFRLLCKYLIPVIRTAAGISNYILINTADRHPHTHTNARYVHLGNVKRRKRRKKNARCYIDTTSTSHSIVHAVKKKHCIDVSPSPRPTFVLS